eukprot:10935063-Alexandrium_andersonii.AAC.1
MQVARQETPGVVGVGAVRDRATSSVPQQTQVLGCDLRKAVDLRALRPRAPFPINLAMRLAWVIPRAARSAAHS